MLARRMGSSSCSTFSRNWSTILRCHPRGLRYQVLSWFEPVALYIRNHVMFVGMAAIMKRSQKAAAGMSEMGEMWIISRAAA